MKETKIEKLILDLSNRWDCSPQEAVDRLNSMNESEINKLINSMTKKFKNGGFIDCLRNGGSISKCKCGCDKIAKGRDGIPDLPQTYTTSTMKGTTKVTTKAQRNPDESVTYTEQQIHNVGTPQTDTLFFQYDNTTPYMDRYQKSRTYYTPTDYNVPGLRGKFRRFFSQEATPEMMNMENGGVVKAQDGNKVRMQNVREATDHMGMTRAQGRMAYANMKNALRNQGFRGRDMRQAARMNIINSAYPVAVPEVLKIEELNTLPALSPSALVARDAGIAPVARSGRPDLMTFSNQSFDEAFANARKMGLGEFGWNGKRYNTTLDNGTQSSTIGETFNGNTTGGSVAPMASTDSFYNAGVRAKEWVKENQPIRSALRALWDPHPEPLNTYDRKGAVQQMVRDYLNENSPRAKARLEK